MVAFCAALADTAQVQKACDAVGVSKQSAFRVRKANPEFAAMWKEAEELAVVWMEDQAKRRAFDGVQKPVFHNGVEVATVREYSDLLTIFLLKAHAPAKYRENSRVELTGADGAPLDVSGAALAAKIAGFLELAESRRTTEELGDLV